MEETFLNNYQSINQNQEKESQIQKGTEENSGSSCYCLGAVLILFLVIGLAIFLGRNYFKNFNKKTGKEVNSGLTPTPKLTEEETTISPTLEPSEIGREKIIKVEQVPNQCKIKIITSEKELFSETNLYRSGVICQSFLTSISPSGQFLAYQDLSGGVDSMVGIYWVKENSNFVLGIYGTAQIFDFLFLPGDKLAVLYGYKGIYDQQYLVTYNVAGLFKTYPTGLHPSYKMFTNLDKYSKVINLPDLGNDYLRLTVFNNKKLRVHTDPEDNSVFGGTLREYDINKLFPK